MADRIKLRRVKRVHPFLLMVVAISPLSEAFGMMSLCSVSCYRSFVRVPTSFQGTTTGLHGILDDMMMPEEKGDSPVSEDTENTNPFFEALLNDLIFSVLDTRGAVAQKKDKILTGSDTSGEPEFLSWLEDTKINAPGIGEEERTALSDIAGAIREAWQEVLLETKAKEEEAAAIAAAREADEAAQAEEGRKQDPVMSAAEVLKKANQIDQAMLSSATDSDEEGAGDFISDCKEVVNLSSKFNSRGQMRVGG